MSGQNSSEQFTRKDADRILVVLGIILFLNGLGGGVAFPIIPLIGPTLGISSFFVSIILSSNRFVRLISNNIAGEIVDRYGPRRPLLFGLAVKAIGVSGYVVALQSPSNQGLIFFLSRSLFGFGSAFGFITIFCILFHLTDESNRGSRTAYIRTASLFGFPAGLAFGGLLANYHSFDASFLAAAAILFVFTGVAYFLIPDLDIGTTKSIGPVEAIRIALSDTRVLRISMVGLFEYFAISGVFLATTALFVKEHGITLFNLGADGMSGVFMAAMMLSKGLATFMVGRLIDQAKSRTSFSILGALLGVISYSLWAFYPTFPAILAGLLLLGWCSGAMSSPLLTLLGDVSREEIRGRTLGVFRVFGDIGGTLGPIFGINMAAAWGFRAMYFTVAMVMMTALALIISLYMTETKTASLQVEKS